MLDMLFDAIGNLALILICAIAPILLLGWGAFKWSQRKSASDREAGQKTRRSLGYE